MKTISTLGILLISIQISFAQESKLWLSLSSGLANSTTSNKSNLIGNGVNFQADAFVPFYRKSSGFMLGVNVSGNYANLKNLSPDNSFIQNEYQIFGSNLAVASQSSAKTSGSFSGLLGLQGRFSFGKINVSPSLNTGYLSFKKEGYVQTGSASINGQNRQIDLVTVEPQNTSGLIFKPQVKVGYNISPNIAFFVSPAMLIGHELTHTVQQRVPQGGFNDRKTYEADQLAKGTWESKSTTSRFNFSELNFGLSVALGKKKPKTTVKPGGAVSSSYARNSSTNANNPDSTSVNQRLSMTPTSAKQTQGKTFGESMAGGLQTNGTATTENETAERRRVEVLKSNKEGDPNKKSVVNEDANEPQGKSISSKGVKRSDVNEMENAKALNNKSTPTHDTSKNSVGNVRRTTNSNENGKSMSQPVVKRSDIIAAPGQPIGGIVVKGGKNPGGNSINSLTNANGEITFTITVPGEYKLQVLEPQGNQQARVATYKKKGVKIAAGTVAPTTNKSISDKGVRRTEAEAIVLGNPIGGIIVKGGKNPGGGNMINAVADENGEITFTAKEVGEYQIQVLAPEGGQEMRVSGLRSKGVKRSEIANENTGGFSQDGGSAEAQSKNGNGAGKATFKEFTVTKKNERVVAPEGDGKSISSKGVKRSEASMARPGQPIKGVIVKGGKNPGGNMRLVSNENGEVSLENLQKGNYLFQLNEPSGKSISEKGLKRTDANAVATPGNPIGGVIVKGGKDPGGSYINLTVNDKGQIGFDVQEAGNYKLIIQTPEAPKAEDNSKKKVVEKATSGLKDTLKTNV